MLEYLTQYKQLLKQFESKQNEVNNINALLTESYTNWISANEFVINLENEKKELNDRYEGLMNKKIKKLRNIIILALCAIYVGLIALSLINYGIGAAILFTPVYVAYGSIIYLVTFILEKCSYVFENIFKKNKDISELLKQIEEKQKELSNAKQVCNKYRHEHDNYFAKSLIANKELTNIQQNINQLKINYATPIFEEQISEDLSTTKTNNEELKLVKKLTPQTNTDNN